MQPRMLIGDIMFWWGERPRGSSFRLDRIRPTGGNGIAFKKTINYQLSHLSTPNHQLNMNPPSLGYVLLFVNDVAASLAFYEKAFGLARRFFNDDHGKAYGELETGATRLAFVSLALAREHLKQEIVTAAQDKAPLGMEIALTTPDVPGLFKRAVDAGAVVVSEPAAKPWGQTVAYLRDNSGFLIEICTPMP